MTPIQELRLYEYIGSLIGQPFQYGQNDCPLMAAGALDCMDGGSRRHEMSGSWLDQRTAWKYSKINGTIEDHLKREGCATVEGGLNYAQQGDLILMDRTLAHDREWHSVGICLGHKVAIMTEEHGLIRIAINELPTVSQVYRWPSQQ